MKLEDRNIILRTLPKVGDRLLKVIRVDSAETGVAEIFVRDQFALVGTLLSRNSLMDENESNAFPYRTLSRCKFVVKKLRDHGDYETAFEFLVVTDEGGKEPSTGIAIEQSFRNALWGGNRMTVLQKEMQADWYRFIGWLNATLDEIQVRNETPPDEMLERLETAQ